MKADKARKELESWIRNQTGSEYFTLPLFDVVIKTEYDTSNPRSIDMTDYTFRHLIKEAYNLKDK